MKSLAITLCLIFLSQSSLASGVAKVIILRGDVKAMMGDKVTKLKKGMWLKEGTTVKTAPKSFAKLLFVDKSSMNVGPKSQMKIDSFPKKDPGVITLVKGQLRSKVTKNYMEMGKKDKSKLFIKTKTAAMGVRGTDFQVNFNPINQATSLVTFSGAVAMAKLDRRVRNLAKSARPQRMLERVVSSDAAVIVKKGQYSGVSAKGKRATLPIKISPVQLETLKGNDVPGLNKPQASNKPKKKFRSIIPPGVDSKTFSNEAKEIENVMAVTVGADVVKEVKTEIFQEVGAGTPADTPPPEGMVNMATGEIAPTAGGYLDLATAQYIPPPEGSQFDPNAGVYIPPPDVGYVDPATGSFANDHYTLNPDGTFEAKVDPIAGVNPNDPNEPGRGPASKGTEGDPNAPPPPPPGVGPLPTMMDGQMAFDPAFAEQFGMAPPPPNGEVPLDDLICTDCIIEDNADAINENLENPNLINRTRVRFNITIE